ncbi:MAG TPA: hypothetical protein VE441_12380, partial [Mycobacterium sp.]|nr:hypothetical protein [Mycobacterium sp.]
MAAVWMRLRWELRSQWRSWSGLVLVISLGGGAAMAAAAGARRTETAYPRFVQAQDGSDIILGGFPGEIDPERAMARAAALPEVLRWARVDLVASVAVRASGRRVAIPGLTAVTDLSGRWGFEVDRFKVVSGRLADRKAPDQAVIDFAAADR